MRHEVEMPDGKILVIESLEDVCVEEILERSKPLTNEQAIRLVRLLDDPGND